MRRKKEEENIINIQMVNPPIHFDNIRGKKAIEKRIDVPTNLIIKGDKVGNNEE